MEKAKKVFKEIGFALAFLALLAIAGLFLFVDKIPIAVDIPEPAVYAMVDRSDFIVATNGIEDAQNETVVFQSTSADLDLYTDELRYITGKTEPLTNPNPGVPDIPTDVIATETPGSAETNEVTVEAEESQD